MQEYYIYWVEEEFCFHYFYKSEVLYRFLNECMSNRSNKELLKQFKYVTRIIPYSELVAHIQNFHKSPVDINIRGKMVEIKKQDQIILLELTERYIILKCNSFPEADAILFQSLKLFDPSFYIIQSGKINSGWLTPVKKEVII